MSPEPEEKQEKSTEVDSAKETHLDQLATELETKVIENPEVLERILEKPEIMAMVHQTFRGPVPPPEMLADYEEIVPGLADRLVRLTEEEQKHRHQWRDKALTSTTGKDKRGQWMAYSLSIIVLCMSAFFAYRGSMVFAGALVGIDLISLASVFAIGRISKEHSD